MGFGALAPVLVVASVATGAFESEASTIKACVATRGGAVRIIDSTAQCAAKETQVLLADGTGFYTKTASDERFASITELAAAASRISTLESDLTALTERVDDLPDTPALLAPTGVQAFPGTAQVTVSWSAVTNATSYEVRRSTVSGGPHASLQTTQTTQVIDNTAANGVTYFYVVRALGSAGTSPDSAEVMATPLAVNQAPIIGGIFGDASYTPGGAATPIAPQATVVDPDSENFSGGVLTVTFTGGDATDVLSVVGTGTVTVTGNSLKVGGSTTVGLWAYDTASRTLDVSFFHTAATALVVRDVVRGVTFQNTSVTPTIGERFASLVLSDGDGGISYPTAVTIQVLNP